MRASSNLVLAAQTVKARDPATWASQIAHLAAQNTELLDAALKRAVGAAYSRFSALSPDVRATLGLLGLVAADIATLQDVGRRELLRDKLLNVCEGFAVAFADVLVVVARSSALEAELQRM